MRKSPIEFLEEREKGVCFEIVSYDWRHENYEFQMTNTYLFTHTAIIIYLKAMHS